MYEKILNITCIKKSRIVPINIKKDICMQKFLYSVRKVGKPIITSFVEYFSSLLNVFALKILFSKTSFELCET